VTILQTERLKLREFEPDDLDELAAMVGDEEQMTFYPRPRTRAEASAWIARNRALYKAHGFGFWYLESRATSGFVGYCGIRPMTLEGASEIEIGWHVRKTAWNQGIGTEAAAAARDLAFGRFGLSRLIAVVHADHVASRRVAEKIGMHQEQTMMVDDYYAAVIYARGRSFT
jgi:RimJ/RimL family protein N-acetyltransferase